jgi:PAS domain S-box-containing protein
MAVASVVGESSSELWPAEALRRGYASLVALPLRDGDRAFGALAIYAGEPEAFGPDEVELLSELSDDLAFGLLTLRAGAERERLAAAVEQTADSITVTDSDGRVVYVNPAFERRSGFFRTDVVGLFPRDMRGEGLNTEAFEAMWAAARRNEVWTGTLINSSRDGRSYEEEMVVSPLHDTAGQFAGLVASGRDVTRERELEDELEREARAQAELATRLGRLRALETPEQTAGAILDEIATLPGLDYLTIGFFAASGLFIPMAVRVPADAPVAAGRPVPPARSAYLKERALMGPWLENWKARPESSAYEAALVGSGLLASAYAPIYGPTSLVGLLIIGTGSPTVAKGIGDQFPALLSFAAIAGALLGETHEQHHREAAARAELEAIITHRAFEPVFQPVVDLRSRDVVGYEALTRFADGIPPAERFAAANELGMGPELELACIRAALAATRRLPPDLWLSVNVSPVLLDSQALAAVLKSTRRRIVLEVTEHAAVADYAAIREAVASFGPRIRLAVDDVGAGYAGLQHILDLRAHIVKLDLALVRGVEDDLARQALIAGMAHFTTRTGSQLLAEGIESEAEARAVIELGAELGQGYLFGRPAALPAFSTAKAVPMRRRLAS